MSFLNTLDEICVVPECDQGEAMELQPITGTGRFRKQPASEPYNILIRGKGKNLYGMIEKYEATFPSRLVNVISEEQFFETLDRVNQLMKKSRKTVKKWWIFGIALVCCTWGYSVWPSILEHRKALEEFKDLLEDENKQIYNKFGLRWRVTRVFSSKNNSLPEFAITIDFLDKNQPTETYVDVHV